MINQNLDKQNEYQIKKKLFINVDMNQDALYSNIGRGIKHKTITSYLQTSNTNDLRMGFQFFIHKKTEKGKHSLFCFTGMPLNEVEIHSNCLPK